MFRNSARSRLFFRSVLLSHYYFSGRTSFCCINKRERFFLKRMENTFYFFWCFLLFFCLLLPSFLFADDWKKVREKNGIVVYERESSSSDIVSLKSEVIISASPYDIYKILKDNTCASDWMPLVAEKRNLEVISEDYRVEYTHIDMPWPIKDRYFINLAKADFHPNGSITIFAKSVDYPSYTSAEKVLGFLQYSKFLLQPVEKGTHITMEVNSDPKGHIPKWFINFAQRKWPINFLTCLIKHLKEAGKLNST